MKRKWILFTALAAVMGAGAASAQQATQPAASTSYSPERGSAAVSQPAPDVTLSIDWTQTGETINRGIFSTQGFMQIYSEKNPMVLETFKFTNPWGTHTRLETYIHQMEPENDNEDPNVFNWEKFHPQRMIRFIEDRAAFEKTTIQLGMEWLSLLCYNADWLKSGDPSAPIRSNEEWAEFAAAVVESYNGNARTGAKDYALRLKYAEVWNEPNHPDFYSGTKQSYFDLFNVVADRLHRDYPGVMVGGPALATTDPNWHSDEWMREFLTACGPRADFISYHHYGPGGEPVERIMDDLKKWVGEFRKIPGKQHGRAMITEIDQWTHGWPKARYVMERQFGFLELSDLILSIHHFCCLAYNESGNYTFGIVDRQGGVLGGTFWPYWMFRSLSGRRAAVSASGTRSNDLLKIAGWDEHEGQSLGTVVMFNRGRTSLTIAADLHFAPSSADRVLVFDRMIRNPSVADTDYNAPRGTVESAQRIPAGATQWRGPLVILPGEAITLILHTPGRRFFPFKDLMNQETPWVGLMPKSTEVNFLGSTVYDVEVRNTLPHPVSGRIVLLGLPAGWKAEVAQGKPDVTNLEFGKSQTCSFRVTAATLTSGGWVAPYAALLTTGQEPEHLETLAHSIPAALKIVKPLECILLPKPVQAVPDETSQITLQLTNLASERIQGTFTLGLPPGMKPVVDSTPLGFDLDPRERARFVFPFHVPENVPLGTSKGNVVVNYMGTTLSEPFEVVVSERSVPKEIRPFDLGPWLNFDAVSFAVNVHDYDQARMGLFSYPGDFTPSAQVVNIRGIPFRFASLEDGVKNVVLPQGQKIPVPEGAYRGVAFIGFGHDGKHPGTWVFHYKDGAVERLESQIPEWCTPPPDGFEVAMRAPYRYYWHSGPASPPCELFLWTLPADANKTLTAVELPVLQNAYIFAMTPVPK